MGKKRSCSECGASAPGKDGLCAACRAVKDGEVETRSEYFQQIGQKGGEASARARAAHGINLEGLPQLKDHRSVKRWLEHLARELASGAADQKTVSEVRKLLKSWLNAHRGEITDEILADLQERLEALEKERRESWGPGA